MTSEENSCPLDVHRPVTWFICCIKCGGCCPSFTWSTLPPFSTWRRVETARVQETEMYQKTVVRSLKYIKCDERGAWGGKKSVISVNFWILSLDTIQPKLFRLWGCCAAERSHSPAKISLTAQLRLKFRSPVPRVLQVVGFFFHFFNDLYLFITSDQIVPSATQEDPLAYPFQRQ